MIKSDKQIYVIAKKKKKTGNNKNGATMGRFAIPPPLPRKFIIWKSGRIYAAVESLTKDQKASGHSYGFPGPAEPMSKLVHQSARTRIQRRLQWMRNAWKRAWLRDTFVYRYRCLGFAAARMEVHSITDLPERGEGLEYETGQTGKVNVSIPKDREED